jgi:hypothetical protein
MHYFDKCIEQAHELFGRKNQSDSKIRDLILKETKKSERS